MSTDSTIGIKLKNPEFNAICAKILHKYRSLSIAEIKQLIATEEYLYSCDYVDSEGIKSIIKLYQEFTASQEDKHVN